MPSPNIKKTLQNKAKASGVPYSKVKAIYQRGLAAWVSGHRAGVPPQAWAIARVNSSLSGGKAATVDKDILKGKSKKSTKKSKKK